MELQRQLSKEFIKIYQNLKEASRTNLLSEFENKNYKIITKSYLYSNHWKKFHLNGFFINPN